MSQSAPTFTAEVLPAKTAAIAAVSGFLRSRSLAVIGASRRRGTVGGELLANLIAGGFTCPIFPVNDRADLIRSLPAYHVGPRVVARACG